MAIEIKPYSREMEALVKAFNQRLKLGGIPFSFPERHVSGRLPKVDDRKIFEDYYLALQGNSIIRGGYILKHQDFFVNGEIKSIGNIQLPLSEGTINKAYNMIGLGLINHALKRQPATYALGMGGFDNPFPRVLRSMGWNLIALPFYFKVIHPYKFLKDIVALRKSKIRREFLDFLAYSGFGWAGIKLYQRIRSGVNFQKKKFTVKEITQFDDWADDLWHKSKNNFSFSAVRDSAVLNTLYPRQDHKFIRLKVSVGNEVVGWALLLATSMSNHKQFGNMRIGSIIDCLSLRDREAYIIEAATNYLRDRTVDLIVSNQSYSPYGAAFKKQGFLEGPSNFIFASSKKLTELLQPFGLNIVNMHLNRGDGDGPMNL
jgi:hypothetical protein